MFLLSSGAHRAWVRACLRLGPPRVARSPALPSSGGSAASASGGGTTLGELKATLDELKALLLEQRAEQRKEVVDLDGRVLEQGASLDKRLCSLDERMCSLEVMNGRIVEYLFQPRVSDLFGESYARPLLARSLDDLVLLWPAGQASVPRSKPPPPEEVPWRMHLATAFSTALVDANIPTKLLLRLRLLAVGANNHSAPWVDERGHLRIRAIGTAIGRTKDQALKTLLAKVLRAARLPREQQIQELLSCSSASIACVIAAAFPAAYLADPGGGAAVGAGDGVGARRLPPFPSDVLEFDFRGRIDAGRDYAYIDSGEAKSQPDYSSAVPQLGVRLGVLRWLLVNCCGVPKGAVRAVGRLFIPASGSTASADKDQVEVARSVWGYSLYLHNL